MPKSTGRKMTEEELERHRLRTMERFYLTYGASSGKKRRQQALVDHISECADQIDVDPFKLQNEDPSGNLKLIENMLDHMEIPYERNFKLPGYDFVPHEYVYDFKIHLGDDVPELLIDVMPTLTHNILVCDTDPRETVIKLTYAREHGYAAEVLYDWDDLTIWAMRLQERYEHVTLHLEDIEIKQITLQEADIFRMMYNIDTVKIDETKLRGHKRYSYGVLYNGDIIQIFTVRENKMTKDSKRRFKYTVCDYVTDPKYNFPEGLKLLVQKFREDIFDVDESALMNYVVDLARCDPRFLNSAGFRKDVTEHPELVWVKGTSCIFHISLKRFGINNLMDTGTTEKIDIPLHMLSDGWLPIWNCGTDVYQLVREE